MLIKKQFSEVCILFIYRVYKSRFYMSGLEIIHSNRLMRHNPGLGLKGSFTAQQLSSEDGLVTAPNSTDVTARKNLPGMVLNKNDWHSSPNLFKNFAQGEKVVTQDNSNSGTLNVLFGKTKASLFDIKLDNQNSVFTNKYGKFSTNPFASSSTSANTGSKFDSKNYFEELNNIQKFFT